MNIAIMISTLQMGGAERVSTTFANWIISNKKNDNVTFVITDTKASVYPLNEKVKVYKRDCIENDSFNKRIKYIFNTLNECNPDIILTMDISNMTYALIYKYIINKKVKVVSSERNNPYIFYSKISKIKLYLLSTFVDGFIFQTDRAKKFFPYKVQKNGVVIHNAVNIEKSHYNYCGKNSKIIVSVGRLEKQKAFDILIKSFYEIKKIYKDYSLIIYGEGSQRKYLENLIQELNLNDSVLLPGSQRNILEKICKCKIFVMTSIFEGMPNALLEAMSIRNAMY